MSKKKLKNTSKDDTTLEYIANWIVSCFTSGYYPCWELSFNNIQHHLLSAGTLQHIANAVADGYRDGEVIESGTNNGWWKIQLSQ
ncbi:MAG: hypothetical protein A3D65_02635 [Candidatus Lloydbacteria bacterium RIFCSPHIGHO2_02_FULL_50_13]|uniref:Uncharacterized protein n=1 Tax=Candidatus Lloydbacteria bacterium RIFCSPHIGHO2_02_FULL_50_13 TaxID=1798661 RepID=A0A1G2D631_9BACT|nr:MAG: hypothetical protein A3D65_02635 [Candidatus Lloydbacteria bacterium RIFCSPHIGHO2_02_FULL_50_13]